MVKFFSKIYLISWHLRNLDTKRIRSFDCDFLRFSMNDNSDSLELQIIRGREPILIY